MVSVVVFDTLGAEGLDTCHGGAEVDKRFAIVFDA